MKTTIVLFIITAGLYNVFGGIIAVTGSSKIKYSTYLGFNISFADEKPSVIKIFKYPAADNSLFINQKIENYRVRFNTTPRTRTNYIDRYSNEIIEAEFVPVKRMGKFNTISYEISFDAIIDFIVFEMDDESGFPVKTEQFTPYEMQFLDKSYGVVINDPEIKRIVNGLKTKKNCISEFIQSAILWVNQEICEIPADDSEAIKIMWEEKDHPLWQYFNTRDVLTQRRAHLWGKLNLAVSLFRSAGIPVRYIKGQSLDSEISMSEWEWNNTAVPLVYYSAKREYYWIEVYFPQFGWLPVDIRKSSLMLFPSYLKNCTAGDIRELHGYDPRGRRIITDFFYDHNIQVEPEYRILTNLPYKAENFFLSPINVKKIDFLFQKMQFVFSGIGPISTNCIFPGYFAEPIPMRAFSKDIEQIRIDAGKDKPYYAQRFSVDQAVIPEKIFLKLMVLNPDGGTIQADIHEDADNTPGKILFSTIRIPANGIRELAVFRYYAFGFPQKKGSLSASLTKGNYWIIPKSSGNTKFHWALNTENTPSLSMHSFQLSRTLQVQKVFDGSFQYYFTMQKNSE